MPSSTNEFTSGASTLRPSVFKVNNEEQKVPAIAFLSGDKYIITCSRSDCLQVREAKTGKPVGDPWQDIESSQICTFAVSPNGQSVATGSKDGKIRLWMWNGRTANIVARSKRHSAAVNCIKWSPHDGGAHIACGFDDGRVAVWPAPIRSSTLELKNPISTDDTRLRHIYAINYSHDGTQLVVSGYDCKLSVLGINERAQEIKLERVVGVCSNPYQVSCATWARTADGHAIVTGSTDGKIRMQASRSFNHEWVFEGHFDRICAVVPSPDNHVLASASCDHTLRLFDLKAKRPIGQPLRHSAELSCAAFAEGGTSLAAGTCDGMVYVWEMSDLLSGATEDITNVGTHIKTCYLIMVLIPSRIRFTTQTQITEV
jgi:WD40 repeat protein